MSKLVKQEETVFTVHAPPHVGHYKLEIFAAQIPKTRGKLNLPVVATFLVEVRLKTLLTEVAAQVTNLNIAAAPSVHQGGQKLASIAETFEVASESGSSGGMYLGTSPSPCEEKMEKSVKSLFSGFRIKGSPIKQEKMKLFSSSERKATAENESRRTSVFSMNRKFSIVPESLNSEDGRY